VPEQPPLTEERFGVDYRVGTEQPAAGGTATAEGFAKVEAVDLDGDGLRDLVAMGWLGATGARLVVFPNHGTGTLAADSALRYPQQPGDGAVLTFAAFEADGSPGAELFVLRTQGAAASGAEVLAEIVELDPVSGQLLVRPLELPIDVQFDAAQWGGCASGDFDGDGVDDIALSTDLGVQLSYGRTGH
jgi:hypothetical protein